MIGPRPTERNSPSWRWRSTSASRRSGPPSELIIAQCQTSVSTRCTRVSRAASGLSGAPARGSAGGAMNISLRLWSQPASAKKSGAYSVPFTHEPTVTGKSCSPPPASRALRPSPST